MPEMVGHRGTIHRVLKYMNRFVDECDLRVKRSGGIILLEEVMCHGTAEFGSCDRFCFFFWRKEWPEEVDEQSWHTRLFHPVLLSIKRVDSLSENYRSTVASLKPVH